MNFHEQIRLISVSKLAKMAGVSTYTIHKARREGMLPDSPAGGRMKYVLDQHVASLDDGAGQPTGNGQESLTVKMREAELRKKDG